MLIKNGLIQTRLESISTVKILNPGRKKCNETLFQLHPENIENFSFLLEKWYFHICSFKSLKILKVFIIQRFLK